MKCWICGCSPTSQNPLSKEHRIKASDLKSYFGPWSLQQPLFFHTPSQKNIPIGGNRSKLLKSQAPICHICNSTLTHPYDDAWKMLSQYLQQNAPRVLKDKWIDISRVFPGATKKSMLDVHLFFVKLFGCQIIEGNIPIEIASFSESLLKRTNHSKLYLAFGPSTASGQKKRALVTPVDTVETDGRTVFAHWVYMLGEIAVTVIYSEMPDYVRVIPGAWQPDTVSKILRLSHFKKQPHLRRELFQMQQPATKDY